MIQLVIQSKVAALSSSAITSSSLLFLLLFLSLLLLISSFLVFFFLLTFGADGTCFWRFCPTPIDLPIPPETVKNIISRVNTISVVITPRSKLVLISKQLNLVPILSSWVVKSISDFSLFLRILYKCSASSQRSFLILWIHGCK